MAGSQIALRRCEDESCTLKRFGVDDAGGGFADSGAAWVVVESGVECGFIGMVPRPAGPEVHFDFAEVKDRPAACREMERELVRRGINRVTAWCHEKDRAVCWAALRAGFRCLYKWQGKVWFEKLLKSGD